jgi:putative membrane protein
LPRRLGGNLNARKGVVGSVGNADLPPCLGEFTAMRRLAPLALFAALGSMSLSACSTTNPAMDMTPEAAPAFVAMAASSNMFEIESSRMALQRSQDPMNRMHAEMMIRDHSNMSAQLRSAAASAGLAIPPQMLPMHAALLNELSRSSNFDATYRRQQVMSHQQSLALMDNYARRGDVPQLRGVAAAAVPVVRAHLDHIRRM